MLKQTSKIVGRLCCDICLEAKDELEAIREYKILLTRTINFKERNNIDFIKDAELYAVLQLAEEDYLNNKN